MDVRFLYRLLVLMIFLLRFSNSFCISDKYRISYLSVQDGLSQNEITSIAQDGYGFMWFGTRGGLNRYDGYQFKHFKPSGEDLNSIPNPSIENIYFTSDNDLLIGLKSGGFVKYDLSLERLNKLTTNNLDDLNRVISFFEDSEGNTWIGSWFNGCACVKQDTVFRYLNSGLVRSIVETEDGTIWIGTSNGLKYKRKDDVAFVTVLNKGITSITVDKQKNCLWLVGWNVDLTKIDYTTLETKNYSNKYLNGSKSYSVLNDSHGRLWVGTWGNGLYQFEKNKERFEKIDIVPVNPNSSIVNYNIVRSIYEDKVGDIWLGTHAGVIRVSESNNFKYFNSLK